MKNKIILLLLPFVVCTFLSAQEMETKEVLIPKYEVKNKALHDTLVAMDKRFFDAYNTCDVEVHIEMISEDLEFYHDMGGLITSKSQLIQALKDNICGKVIRELIPGTIEVYPIPGYGAVQMGWHQFYNKMEPNAMPKPSKFITIWKNENGRWLITRVVSLH